MRCQGFYEYTVGLAGGLVSHIPGPLTDDGVSYTTARLQQLEMGEGPGMRRLPAVNFLDFGDSHLVDALLEEVLVEDRDRFSRYMSNRLLGLGLVTAVSLSPYPIK